MGQSEVNNITSRISATADRMSIGNVIATPYLIRGWQSRYRRKPGYRIEIATSLRSSQ